MIWTCLSCYRCECTKLNENTPSNPFASILHERTDKIPEALQASNSAWREIVCRFSSLKITKNEDRFPALSGIASRFAPYFQSQYLAGLWRMHLPEDFLWQVSSTAKSRRVQPYIAPTWSWASVDFSEDSQGGTMSSYEASYRFAVDSRVAILGAECTLAGVNTFGEVKSGIIKVQGPYIAMTCYPQAGTHHLSSPAEMPPAKNEDWTVFQVWKLEASLDILFEGVDQLEFPGVYLYFVFLGTGNAGFPSIYSPLYALIL
jgi:hypothetical protein